ncbi:RNA methyltransferase [Shinella sp. 838]|jgi:tRNA G18 (ribose-2'-O)-methylase SpoU|uniref:TrmH family RNA methyltransferase n=1 Tax=unclassified Shinella TaxID=2643062 RepID=UPI0003C56BBE|nr:MULTISPECIES: RNA methyltransferase [unclassified Shinella]EYR80836.1 tRNA/rRNA methyltransferase [Shinella sp. DD12]MCA0339378.1 RNA methyltransferase [Pseudomonadota bacterium]MDG4669882.1 RNA methyltransferase [Shinella sp. 838]
MAAQPVRIDDPADPRIAGFVSIRERDLTGRDGLFVAEGTVVLRMLGAPTARENGFAAEAILLLENRLAGVADVLASFPETVPVYIASSAVFDAVAGFNMHRGVLALGSKPPVEQGATLLGRLPETSLVLAGCGLSNHDNVGSIFRNAAAFGADAVFLDETSCDPLYRKAIRVSVGSVLSVPFSRGLGAEAMLGGLAQAGFEIWGLSPRGAVPVADIPAARRIALVLGTEGEGLPDSILSSFRTARIPQRPGLDSLNVATASGIALYQIALAMERVA